MHTPLTLAEVRELPAAVDLVTAGRAFNLGRTLAYTLARQGRFPVPVHRHGRTYRVHTTDILNALTEPDPPTTPAPAEQ
ncbi:MULTISPECIES: hypothetical protein [unclassified Pseudofrankia]|uniref:hypothetical protein n=1 Tax=unclassified Pseudofrankia TaxID=2994372 RepID=UPI0008D91150|nr:MULTISPECIES: hypothetical protein [unclassified Pseudofrankia]MDT3444453.1 DNA-binding protein [Pseudofrankia sp. BMG5.37]OHV57980.1 hypothetical protein BCD48_42655 [Pseudofrankia sp. BMG5.36]